MGRHRNHTDQISLGPDRKHKWKSRSCVLHKGAVETREQLCYWTGRCSLPSSSWLSHVKMGTTCYEILQKKSQKFEEKPEIYIASENLMICKVTLTNSKNFTLCKFKTCPALNRTSSQLTGHYSLEQHILCIQIIQIIEYYVFNSTQQYLWIH